MNATSGSIRCGSSAITILLSVLIATPASTAGVVAGWPLADSRYDSQKIAALNRAIENRTYKDINSIVVIDNGALLIERYYNGADRSGTLPIARATAATRSSYSTSRDL